MGLNGTYQFLVYATASGVVIISGENTYTIQRNIKIVLEASMDVGLEVNTEKTEYVAAFRHQNIG
jgi:hypothetical protein